MKTFRTTITLEFSATNHTNEDSMHRALQEDLAALRTAIERNEGSSAVGIDRASISIKNTYPEIKMI